MTKKSHSNININQTIKIIDQNCPADMPIAIEKHDAGVISNGSSAFSAQLDQSTNKKQTKKPIKNTLQKKNLNNTNDTNDQTVCYCSVTAILNIVQKEGSNKGRQFYGCGNKKSCKFFMVSKKIV